MVVNLLNLLRGALNQFINVLHVKLLHYTVLHIYCHYSFIHTKQSHLTTVVHTHNGLIL